MNLLKDDIKLSVLMTSYNRESLIIESIQSVLKSSYSEFEFIIVDDSSTDSTWFIIQEFALIDKRIKAYRNDSNLGDYLNRNKAVSYAKGKYIKFVDSDDVIEQDCLESMISQMETYPNVYFGLSSDRKWLEKQSIIVWTPSDLFNIYFFHGKAIGTPPTGSIFRRDAFISLGGFSGKQYLGDTEMWLKFSVSYNALIFPNDLYHWREHSDQQMVKEKKNLIIKYQRFQMLLDFISNSDLSINYFHRKMAERNLKNIQSRLILLNILRAKFSIAQKDFHGYRLRFFDLIISLMPNKYPKFISYVIV
jgi:glycosyltransferase involved in cell wall biosynthesis